MSETDPGTFARDLTEDLKELEKELKRTRAEALERVEQPGSLLRHSLTRDAPGACGRRFPTRRASLSHRG